MYPFFEPAINLHIQNAAEHTLYNQIMGMNYEQLDLIRCDLNTEIAINHQYVHTQECRLKANTVLRRMQQLKHAGKLHPTPSILDCINDFAVGWIIADEFLDRI